MATRETAQMLVQELSSVNQRINAEVFHHDIWDDDCAFHFIGGGTFSSAARCSICDPTTEDAAK